MPLPDVCPRHDEAVKLCLECSTGVWAVGTLSGTVYVLDLDRMTQTRWPDMRVVEERLGVGESPARLNPGAEEAALPSAMRRDRDSVRLVALRPVVVGEPMVMVVDVVGDGVTYTTRQTTVVVEVRKLKEART